MCSPLVSGHGLKNEIYSCLARLFLVMDVFVDVNKNTRTPEAVIRRSPCISHTEYRFVSFFELRL